MSKLPIIVLTGAGSGGHITPLLAVADEIKSKYPKTLLIYIGQKGDALGDIPAKHPSIDDVYTVRAGKFRRYHGEGFKQLLDVITIAKNCRDAVYVLIGLFQSWKLLRAIQPDVIFIKGGFVGVPVGLAAARLKVPYLTHDSDAIPGLANKIIAKWARIHAVALPKETYEYPQNKTVMTGIPLQESFEPLTPALVGQYRKDVGIPLAAKLLFVIGGGLGSQRINGAVTEAVPHLMQHFPDLYVIHVVGRQNAQDVSAQYKKHLSEAQEQRLQVHGYLEDVYRYSGAADLIITRAGATNLAEFAVQGKACIVVPSPFLTGGHQLKNASVLESQGAISVLPENELLADPNRLSKQVSALLLDDKQRLSLGTNFSKLAVSDASARIARLLYRIATHEA